MSTPVKGNGGRGSKGANWQGELSPFALPNISEENDEKGDVPKSYRNSKIGIVPKYGKVWSCYISRRTNIAIVVVAMFLLMVITAAITYYIATVLQIQNNNGFKSMVSNQSATTTQTNQKNEVSTKATPKITATPKTTTTPTPNPECVSETRQFAIEGVQYFALGEGEAIKISKNTTTKTISALKVQLTLE